MLDAVQGGILSLETSRHVLANITTVRAACENQEWATFFLEAIYSWGLGIASHISLRREGPE